MRSDLSDITIIMDTSGSMGDCHDEAVTGINHFVESQRKLPGDALLTLIQFNNHSQVVFSGRPLKDVSKVDFQPNGMTALLDAVGLAIDNAGERLSAMQESERPGLVVFVISTDGEENYSSRFTAAQVKEKIEHQQSIYNWKFVFLGADQDACLASSKLGISGSSTMSHDSGKYSNAYDATASLVTRMRTQTCCGLVADCIFADDERSAVL